MKVVEIFKSLQGEGYNAGREAVFIRFAGCNLNCEWCDTFWKEGKEMSIKEIVDACNNIWDDDNETKTKNVILTGGEPLIQDSLMDLINELQANQWKIYIEPKSKADGNTNAEKSNPETRENNT